MTENKICPHCKNSLPEDSEFCQYCGTKISPIMNIHREDPCEPIQENCSSKDDLGGDLFSETTSEHTKTSRNKNKLIIIISISVGIIVALAILFSILLIPQYKYNYVLDNKNNDNLTTYEYLKDLKKRDYKDSADIYEELYGWEVTVIAVNSSESDETTHKNSINKYSPVYFHIKLTGGEPNAKMRITVKATLPNGIAEEYTFDDKWESGEYGWYGWYDGIYSTPEYGSTGTLQCKFYDENDNLIGVGSVIITDSVNSQIPNNSNATNNSNFQGSTDSSPTCLEFSCNNGVTYTGQYCYEHKCFNATCTFKKNFNSNYCSVCECGYAGCHNAQISLGFYCYEHTCAKSGCNSQKSFNSNYCILHD